MADISAYVLGVQITPGHGQEPDEAVLVLQAVTTQEQMDELGLAWDDVIEPQSFSKVRVKFAQPPLVAEPKEA